MKTAWSMLVSMLLMFLASGFLVFAANSPQPLFVTLGVAALGLSFLVAFIHFTRPENRTAGKLATMLNIAAGSLFVAALVLWLLQAFNIAP